MGMTRTLSQACLQWTFHQTGIEVISTIIQALVEASDVIYDLLHLLVDLQVL